MVVTPSGMVISCNEAQPLKTERSRAVRPSGRETVVSEVQPLKARASMVLTLSGMVTLLSAVQSMNAALLIFVMSQIKIDMVWFKALIEPVSYVLSLVLTLVAACIVDYVFYFKLDKINMAEALKSVE